MDHEQSISYANDYGMERKRRRRNARSARLKVEPFPFLTTKTEKIPTPSDVVSRSRGDMREGVKTRIGGSRKISDFFPTTYESDITHLAANAQGLATESAIEIASGGIVYTHGPGKYREQLDEPLILHTENPTTKEIIGDYYLSDVLGSITELVDKNGTITGEIAYNSFGKITHSSGIALDQPYSFTGRELDVEFGMYFMRRRTYNPVTGCFNQTDPFFVKPQNILQYATVTQKFSSLYLYAIDNPIRFVDPSGLKVWGFGVGVGVSSSIPSYALAFSFGGVFLFVWDDKGNSDFAACVTGFAGAGISYSTSGISGAGFGGIAILNAPSLNTIHDLPSFNVKKSVSVSINANEIEGVRYSKSWTSSGDSLHFLGWNGNLGGAGVSISGGAAFSMCWLL